MPCFRSGGRTYLRGASQASQHETPLNERAGARRACSTARCAKSRAATSRRALDAPLSWRAPTNPAGLLTAVGAALRRAVKMLVLVV